MAARRADALRGLVPKATDKTTEVLLCLPWPSRSLCLAQPDSMPQLSVAMKSAEHGQRELRVKTTRWLGELLKKLDVNGVSVEHDE